MHDEAREQLRAKESDLVAQMDQLTRPMQEQGAISFGKRVGDGTAMAVDRLTAVTAHDNLQTSLDQVRAALRAIDDGSYGRCSVCGDTIPAPRLEARPWSTTCLRHG
ncbi:TraR/DksA family transcriptional regulator [Serinicoccus kebangsaanensis]|uniref:TraR/DksA family transcriptional regulator n=1 Tax=Serinicoccus kebangsaanensis TaxID=2602069 RepID=UPI00124F482A|nr:TraR/DksA C4-type zinc finger protein [Serinicoccus kebangsaanensis]